MPRLAAASLALTATLTGAVLAAPSAPAVPNRFTVRVKMVDAKGHATLVPVAEITRANGVVTTKLVAAPALDALAKTFVDDWNAYKQPASVKITESIANNTGMQPDYHDHTYTFTAKDALYKAALVRTFVETKGYNALGLSTIDFVEYDRSAEYPPGADDRASTMSNFRKGKTLEYGADGTYSIYISKPIRPIRSDSKGRVSASDKTHYLAASYDEGAFEVGIIFIHSDGRIEVKPRSVAEAFTSDFGTFTAKEDVEVKTVKNDEYSTWEKRVIKKTSSQLLEAYILENLEYRHDYDVTPVIDPQTVR